MSKKLIALFSLFSRHDKYQMFFALLMNILSGLIEAIGFASIMPFIALISDPSLSTSNPIFSYIIYQFSFDNHQSLLIFLGLFAFFSLFVSNIVSITDYWYTLKFCNEKEYELSYRLLNNYLNQRYLDFENRSFVIMSKTILADIERVISDMLLVGIDMVSDLVIALCILAFLLYIDPFITLVTALLLSMGYLTIFLSISKRLSRLGQEYTELETEVHDRLKQALDFYREAKIRAHQNYFLEHFRDARKQLSDSGTYYGTLSVIPSQLIEILAFGSLILVALYFAVRPQGPFNTVTTIALYAFAAYRLIPVMRELFLGVEALWHGTAVLDIVIEEFRQTELAEIETLTQERLALEEYIVLEELSFRYPAQKVEVIHDLSGTIPSQQMTCIIGPSGTGKSTLIHLLLGFIEPDAGRIRIDNQVLTHDQVRKWQNNIGFVPQAIQLNYCSLAENIAFGYRREHIDLHRCKVVATIAGIHDYIETELQDGYWTIIGDRGFQLSGGQKQRIGIARSLYHDPDVLVFDEATNELDDETENHLFRQLRKLDKTIIFVSHKHRVIHQADHTIELISQNQSISKLKTMSHF